MTTAPASALAPIAELAGHTAEWRRTGFFTAGYELVAGGRTFATLSYFGALHHHATLAGADGEWFVEQRGLLRAGLTVRRTGQDAPLAALERDWWGNGVLQFESGPRYAWRRLSLWRGRYALLSSRERALLTIQGTFLRTRSRLVLEVAPEAAEARDLTILAGVALAARLLVARRAAGG